MLDQLAVPLAGGLSGRTEEPANSSPGHMVLTRVDYRFEQSSIGVSPTSSSKPQRHQARGLPLILRVGLVGLERVGQLVGLREDLFK